MIKDQWSTFDRIATYTYYKTHRYQAVLCLSNYNVNHNNNIIRSDEGLTLETSAF